MSRCMHDNAIQVNWDVDWCPDCGAHAIYGEGWVFPTMLDVERAKVAKLRAALEQIAYPLEWDVGRDIATYENIALEALREGAEGDPS